MRNVDWKRQYDTYRPKVSHSTDDDELFDIFCRMLDPLNDGHVELKATTGDRRKKRYFNPEPKPLFWREFTKRDIKQLFKTTASTLVANGFSQPAETEAWLLHYGRSRSFAYVRILELEDVRKKDLTAALDKISSDVEELDGIIIDIRNNPGGDDSTVLQIINRFCDRKRIAFHRKTRVGPEADDFTDLKTWYMEPQGRIRFTKPIVLLTCDSVFSGAEVFALAIRQLPHATIVGDHTNGIFSYQLEKRLPNGWRYCLSYQKYYSADMVCFEGKGVPVDIELFNNKSNIEDGVDPLIVQALEVLRR